MALQVRALTDEERTELRRRTQSRTDAARTVERARIIWLVQQGQSAPVVARRLGLSELAVRRWIKRFNAAGLSGLADQPRSGRPTTYRPEQVGQVVAVSLTDPQHLGLPFGAWTLDRLTTYLHERPPEAGGPLPISRSQINRLLAGEGLRWRKQETWFGERVDPAFVEKRGPSNTSGWRRLRVVWSSTSTNSGRRAPRVTPA
jgi:transposase